MCAGFPWMRMRILELVCQIQLSEPEPELAFLNDFWFWSNFLFRKLGFLENSCLQMPARLSSKDIRGGVF